MKRNTPWTPWMPVNVTQGGARQEQRMRYMCRAHLSDPHELQIGRRKVETRYCPNDGTAACETDSKFRWDLLSGCVLIKEIQCFREN